MRSAALLWLALTLAAWAEPPLTPRQAVERALRAHPTLTHQQELARAAQAGRDRVESDLYPHLSLEAVVKDGPPGTPNFRLPGLGNAGFPQSAGGDLILTQTFDFGRTSQRLLAQTFASQAAQQQTEVERARLSLNVLRSYGQVVLARELVALARDVQASRQELALRADARFRAGLVSRVDSGLAEADLSQARADVIELQSQLDAARAGLGAAMGEAQADASTLEKLPTELEEWNHDLDQDRNLTLASRPEIKVARAQVDSARALVGSAQAGYNPYLSLFAAGGYISNLNGPPGSPNTFGVGVALSVPVYTAGGVQAEIRQEDHKLAAALAGEREVLLGLQLQLQQARIRFASLRERRAALEQQEVAALYGCKLARTRYQLGLGNILEVQQAELARLRASTNLVRNRSEIWLSWVELLYVTGRLLPNFTEEACQTLPPGP